MTALSQKIMDPILVDKTQTGNKQKKETDLDEASETFYYRMATSATAFFICIFGASVMAFITSRASDSLVSEEHKIHEFTLLCVSVFNGLFAAVYGSIATRNWRHSAFDPIKSNTDEELKKERHKQDRTRYTVYLFTFPLLQFLLLIILGVPLAHRHTYNVVCVIALVTTLLEAAKRAIVDHGKCLSCFDGKATLIEAVTWWVTSCGSAGCYISLVLFWYGKIPSLYEDFETTHLEAMRIFVAVWALYPTVYLIGEMATFLLEVDKLSDDQKKMYRIAWRLRDIALTLTDVFTYGVLGAFVLLYTH